FHYDDLHGIVYNPAIRDLRNTIAFFTDPSTLSLADYADWRPVLQLTYAIDYAIWGLNPTGFRILNLLLHVASAILVYLIFAETTNSHSAEPSNGFQWRMPGAPLIAAALFAVHPANSQAVNYIWARSALLAAFFYLVGFYCFLRGPLQSNTEGRTTLWHIAGLISYILGLATKATVITLPAALILCEFLRPSSPAADLKRFHILEWGRAKTFIPALGVSLGYLGLRAFLLPDNFTGVLTSYQTTSLTYLLTSTRAWLYYLKFFLWPQPMIIDFHDFGWSGTLWDTRVLFSLVVIIVVLGGAWRAWKFAPSVTFFILWFFIALFPETSFIPLTEPINCYRPYLAYAGLCIVVTKLGLDKSLWLRNRTNDDAKQNLRGRWVAQSAVVVIVLTMLAAMTIKRNLIWRNEFTLWSDVLQKDPTNSRAHMSLGRYFLDANDYERAKEMLEKAVQLAPKSSPAYLLRGHLNSLLNRTSEALEDFNKAVALGPRSAYNWHYRAELYAKLGQFDKALQDYRVALSLKPKFTDAYFRMAIAYLQTGENAQAMELCRKIWEIDRYDARAYKCVGRILMEQKKYTEAALVYKKALASLPDSHELWLDLGVVYNQLSMFAEAALAFEKSTQLSRKLAGRPQDW
ncbi:MAG: tetratricopeptide repeat protein, partial [Candidatus Binatia bacterium]|nr:tetratricopeptide repeat protein [Candidatus Binatia bacterium]